MAEKKADDKNDGEAEVREKITEMDAPYRAMGERLHELIMESEPGLTPRTWYGMPAYAKSGKVVCFFNGEKEYMSFGLTPDANLSSEESVAH